MQDKDVLWEASGLKSTSASLYPHSPLTFFTPVSLYFLGIAGHHQAASASFLRNFSLT